LFDPNFKIQMMISFNLYHPDASKCPYCVFSGCVTTAETVLIEAQSIDELITRLEDRNQWKQVVFSIAPQVLASLGAAYQLPMPECYRKLTTFFRQYLRADFIFDTSFSRDLALLEQAAEFVARFQHKQGSDPSAAPATLPMLASSCPGWICYAEKTHGSYILPYISTTKSPQQIMGSLVKTFLPKVLQQRQVDPSAPIDLAAGNILHVSIMPCFDKKLEASRQDFYSDLLQSHDVDLVLTSTEVQQLLQRYNVDFASLPSTTPPVLFVSPLFPVVSA
jgi:iron only hydrogenase large subunit-like protein